jgi:hypothetical protein
VKPTASGNVRTRRFTAVRSTLGRFLIVLAAGGCDDDRDLQGPADSLIGTDREVLRANAVRLAIDNVGSIGADGDGPFDGVGFFPAPSENRYLLRAGLWVGGRHRGVPVVATAQDAFEGVSEFVPGRRLSKQGQGDRILCSSRPADLAAWYPEFRDPQTGAPLVVGDLDCVVIFNDGRHKRGFDVQPALGIEVRQRAVLFREGLASQAVVFVWDVLHTGAPPLSDAHVAVFAYPEIGQGFDERCSVVLRTPSAAAASGAQIAFCWDHDFTEQEFGGDRPGFLGVSFLGVPDEVQRPLTRFTITHHINFRPQPDPSGDDHELAVLLGAAPPLIDDTPADNRFLAITGPLLLSRDRPARIVAAFLWANAAVAAQSLAVDGSRCFPEGRPCFLPDPNDPALAELIAVDEAVRQLVNERLPAP